MKTFASSRQLLVDLQSPMQPSSNLHRSLWTAAGCHWGPQKRATSASSEESCSHPTHGPTIARTAPQGQLRLDPTIYHLHCFTAFDLHKALAFINNMACTVLHAVEIAQGLHSCLLLGKPVPSASDWRNTKKWFRIKVRDFVWLSSNQCLQPQGQLSQLPLTCLFEWPTSMGKETCFLQEDLPAGMRVIGITDGAATLRGEDNFEAKLILIPAPKDTDLGLKVEGDESYQIYPSNRAESHTCQSEWVSGLLLSRCWGGSRWKWHVFLHWRGRRKYWGLSRGSHCWAREQCDKLEVEDHVSRHPAR